MIARIARSWQRLRRALSRTEWLIRLLGLARTRTESDQPGLVMVQIDGLSHRQLQRALAKGRMPFLARLLRRRGYELHRHYSGLPSSTPAVQGELFYGQRTAVPAFGFRDKRLGRIVRMYEAEPAERIESELEQQDTPLLAGGTAYMDVYTGGAEESHFCVSELRPSRIFATPRSVAFLLALLLNPISLVRVVAVFGLEVVLALVDAARGLVAGRDLWKELKFVPIRVGICILARDLITISARMDVSRGFPIVHMNLLGYDEQSHRRGPSSHFAHWTLGGIDSAIRRVWRKAQQATGRDYDIWIYSDHGQEDAVPYTQITGETLHAAIRRVYSGIEREKPESRAETHGVQTRRLRGFRHRNDALDDDAASRGDTDGPLVTAMGPIGHIYWPHDPDRAELERTAQALVDDAQVPLVLVRAGEDVQAFTTGGAFLLPRDADQVLGAGHPYRDDVGRDLVELCKHPEAGHLVVSGFRRDAPTIAFPKEHGTHAGPDRDETGGFALLPGDAVLPGVRRDYLRPADLRRAAQIHLGRVRAPARPVATDPHSRTVRLLTYNVHSCIGMDGRLSVRRIARVIAQTEADIVALQELDKQRRRTKNQDQARQIAEQLRMEHHFHPSIALAGEYFGNAVMSRLPMRVMKTGPLPGTAAGPRREPRAAVWVNVDVNGTCLQVINTHLGLNRGERVTQAQALLGRDWYGGRDADIPVVLCGDLNALPTSLAYRHLCRRLRDAQTVLSDQQPQATWPARWPLGRIDHVFVSRDVIVRDAVVLDDELACVASDHRPLLTTLEVPATT